MSQGQLIGSIIENAIWIAAGLYIVFLWPKRVQRQIASGKLTEEEGHSRLKKFRPQLGYLVVALGVLRICGVLFNGQ
ncbi:hypothetical protein ACXR0O_00490 [Verrucomicrobiota bacterium sgz303538]